MGGKRAVFSSQDRTVLLELVNKHKHIIENKKSDCINLAQKKTWATLATDFNSLPETSKRTADQLKKCWENVKARRKKDLADAKRKIFKTGGGEMQGLPAEDPSVDDVLNDVDIEIKDALDSDTYTPLHEMNASTAATTIDVEEELLDWPVIQPETEFHNKETPFKNKSFLSRGTAIEKELQARLDRNTALQLQDEELHALKMDEQQLKVKEQKMKLREAELRKLILEEQFQQEILKAELLRKEKK